MTNGYQQPPQGSQQQPPQQPQYQPQPPQYPNYGYQQRPPMDFSAAILKMTKVMSLVFVILAGVAILYGIIFGIVAAAGYYGSATSFFSYLANGVFHSALYLFFAIISAFISKKL